MKAPLLSICLPTRNSAQFLEARLRSIVAQSFDDWHVVVVDTSSTDGTLEMIRDLIPEGKRTIWNAGPGLYQAWNSCVAYATGELIHFATSDDFEHPSFYERLVAIYRETGCDIIHCLWAMIDEMGRTVETPIQPTVRVFGSVPGRVYRKDPTANFFSNLLVSTTVGASNAALLKRSLFDRIGGFPTQYGAIGDRGWYLRASLCATTYCLDETLASWRVRTGQATIRYGRFDFYRKEAAIIPDTIAQMAEDLAQADLTAGQRAFVADFAARNRKLAGAKGDFPVRLALLYPDKLVHAVTKLLRPNFAPLWFSRMKLHALLSGRQPSIPFEKPAAVPEGL
jgi:glycosyltransferase involved in cell wall biosynthesis